VVYANGANITFAQGGAGSVSFYESSTQGSVGTVIPECAAESLTTFTAPNNIAACTGSATLNGLKAGTYYITAVFSGDPTNVESTSAQFTLTLS
jgi:hypothetical protein